MNYDDLIDAAASRECSPEPGPDFEGLEAAMAANAAAGTATAAATGKSTWAIIAATIGLGAIGVGVFIAWPTAPSEAPDRVGATAGVAAAAVVRRRCRDPKPPSTAAPRTLCRRRRRRRHRHRH